MLFFWRIIKNGCQNFYRNGIFTIGTLIVVTACLLSINLMLLVFLLTDSSINLISNQIDINLELNNSIQKNQIAQLQQHILSIPKVTNSTYFSSEFLLQNLQKNHPDISSFINDYSLKNPLPARINIKISQPLDRNQIITNIKKISQIETLININKLNDNLNNNNQIKKLLNIISWLKKLFISLVIFFVFLTLLIILNTIKITILSQKDEIKTMLLIGAPKAYIMGPFLIEGLLYWFIAGILSTFLVFPIITLFSDKINLYLQKIPLAFSNSLFEKIFSWPYSTLTSFYQNNFLNFLFLLIVIGSFIGLFGSWLAIGKTSISEKKI